MDKDLKKKDMEIILNVCKELNLQVFLDAGLLLGAIREKDFIANDSDFDFGVFRKEFDPLMQENLIKLLTQKNLTFKGFEAPCFERRLDKGIRKYLIKFWSKYAHFNTDFWIFEQRIKDYYHPGWGGYFYFLKENLDTLDEIDFLGFKVMVPHNPEIYLEHLYGRNWKIPKHMNKPGDYPNFSRIFKI